MNNIKTFLIKLKSISKNHSWLTWLILLFILITYTKGLKTSLISSGIMISGFSLGIIIPTIIGVFFKKYEIKSIYWEIILFSTSTTILYLYVPDKKLLLFMFPLSIPTIIMGLLNLKE